MARSRSRLSHEGRIVWMALAAGLPGSLVALLGRYVRQSREANANFDPATFIRSYVTLAAQRASKILGIFARLDVRDGKPQYLRHIPRIWRYLARGLAHPDLAALARWFDRHLPREIRNDPPDVPHAESPPA